jgi:hypothetical protein
MRWKKIKNFKLQMLFLRRLITAFLASNLLAQFFRQIVVQILGMASPKVCGNLAIRSLLHTSALIEPAHKCGLRKRFRSTLYYIIVMASAECHSEAAAAAAAAAYIRRGGEGLPQLLSNEVI